jgi:phage-related minor tail protein
MDNQDFERDAAQRQRQLETLDRLAQRFGTSLSSALSRNVAEGRRLDDALSRVGRSLLNVTLRAAMRPLRSSLESLFRGAFAGDGGGDAPTPFAKGGVVAAPTYFPLGRGLGIMGEQGAEAVMPLARGPDGRLGVRAGGTSARPVQVTINISTPDAESFRRSEAQVSAALARVVARGQRAS